MKNHELLDKDQLVILNKNTGADEKYSKHHTVTYLNASVDSKEYFE